MCCRSLCFRVHLASLTILRATKRDLHTTVWRVQSTGKWPGGCLLVNSKGSPPRQIPLCVSETPSKKLESYEFRAPMVLHWSWTGRASLCKLDLNSWCKQKKNIRSYLVGARDPQKTPRNLPEIKHQFWPTFWGFSGGCLGMILMTAIQNLAWCQSVVGLMLLPCSSRDRGIERSCSVCSEWFRLVQLPTLLCYWNDARTIKHKALETSDASNLWRRAHHCLTVWKHSWQITLRDPSETSSLF